MNRLRTSPRSRQWEMGTRSSAPAEMYASDVVYRGSHQGMRPLRPCDLNANVASSVDSNPSSRRASPFASAQHNSVVCRACYSRQPETGDYPINRTAAPGSSIFRARSMSWVNSPSALSWSSDNCKASAPHLATSPFRAGWLIGAEYPQGLRGDGACSDMYIWHVGVELQRRRHHMATPHSRAAAVV